MARGSTGRLSYGRVSKGTLDPYIVDVHIAIRVVREVSAPKSDRFDASLTDMCVHRCDQRKPQRNRSDHYVGTTVFGRREAAAGVLV